MRIFNRRSNNGTNVTEPNAIVQTGWASTAINTSTAAYIINVTFPKAFTSAPIVMAINGGDALTATGNAYGNGGNTIVGDWTCKAFAVTTTGFSIKMSVTPSGNPGAAGFVFAQWIAIGN